jgi:hypothetical protein
MAGPLRPKVVCLCGFEVRFGEPPKPAREPREFPGFKIQKNKMPDVVSYDSSSGIAVDVQQRLNCALP